MLNYDNDNKYLKLIQPVVQRCSEKRCSYKFHKIHRKTPVPESLCLRPATLLAKKFWHRYFSVNFVKFLRAPFYTEHLWWLLLILQQHDNKFSFWLYSRYWFSVIYMHIQVSWVFSCKFAAYFQKTFSLEHVWTAATASWLVPHLAPICRRRYLQVLSILGLGKFWKDFFTSLLFSIPCY